MAEFPIYYHTMYDAVLSKDGKFHLTCTDVSDHDFVEVVRCKDCYAYQRNPDFAKAADINPEEYCALLRCEFGPDGFCSYGRRVENGN